jgi:tRNA modification GTPase
MNGVSAPGEQIPAKAAAVVDSDCVVSQLTAVGRGAIATVAVSGPNATEHVDAVFVPLARRALSEVPPGQILFGRWQAAGPPGEDVVVCRRSLDHVEVHCHGGRVAAAVIVDSLVARGCREIAWPQWIVSESDDPIAADARIALASATTDRTAGVLLDQLRGALSRAVLEIDQSLRDGTIQRAGRSLSELLGRADFGLHLTCPWQVVLTGQANVGKSSLINAILGYQRSIVYEQPGTTRDVLAAHTALDGWPVELVDTAGLRSAPDTIEAEGIQLARSRLAAADLIVLVFDATQAWTAQDQALAGQWPQAIVAYNKSDLLISEAAHPPGLLTSALTGRGVPELIAEIVTRLIAEPPPAGAAVPFLPRHLETVRAALAAVEEGRFVKSRRILRELLASS